MNFQWIKKLWKAVNDLPSFTKSILIFLLLGNIFYFQITTSTKKFITEKFKEEILNNKIAEKYSIQTSVELNRQIQLIAERDTDAFDVLLLNYHNNTQSLQGYKYLYLSCLTEAPKSLDIVPVRQQWNRIDYIYYADELSKIHQQSFVQIEDIETMKVSLPKLYRLVKSSDAKAIAFYTIEGHDTAIGLIVVLYPNIKKYGKNYNKMILPCIQRLAILLDYDNLKNGI